MRKRAREIPTIPAPGEGKRGVDGHIGYLLRQAHTAHRIRMEQALSPYGLTLPQFSVLTMLAAYPGASGAALARLSLLTPQTMSVIVANLERVRLVARHAHPGHGRIQTIELTSAGKAILSKCKSAAASAESALLAGFGDRDERVVRRWLAAIARGVPSHGGIQGPERS